METYVRDSLASPEASTGVGSVDGIREEAPGMAASPSSVRSETIDQARARRMAGSARLHARARDVFPDGVTHDGRYMEPFPIYCTHGRGPRKWDVDGNEYVDYFGGHGALLLGHSHPAIVEAGARQAGGAAPLGAC